jgi:Histidine phosphatase superfamily (branch 1)
MDLQGQGVVASNGNPNTIRSIRVIMLRHGEREDETDDYDHHHRCLQDRIDPYLTPFGYRQALHAWKRILHCLQAQEEEKPIVIATSPLRRCIGTAVMVSAAVAELPQSSVKFVLPSSQKQAALSDTYYCNLERNPTIPVLVMNGLGDCAAQMQHMGGIGKVVIAGWLDLAASPSNDDTTCTSTGIASDTRFQSCLGSICKHAADESVGFKVKKDDTSNQILPNNPHESSDNGSNHSTCTSVPLQFWRESFYHYTSTTTRTHPQQDLSSLTQARTLEEHANNYYYCAKNYCDLQQQRRQSPPTPMATNTPSSSLADDDDDDDEERCCQALERAVLQTAHSDLNTCVLITHREAIRYVEEHWIIKDQKNENNAAEGVTQKNHARADATRRRMSATKLYCCVAIYQVTVDIAATSSKVLHWKCKAVVPYQALQPDHMTMS